LETAWNTYMSVGLTAKTEYKAGELNLNRKDEPDWTDHNSIVANAEGLVNTLDAVLTSNNYLQDASGAVAEIAADPVLKALKDDAIATAAPQTWVEGPYTLTIDHNDLAIFPIPATGGLSTAPAALWFSPPATTTSAGIPANVIITRLWIQHSGDDLAVSWLEGRIRLVLESNSDEPPDLVSLEDDATTLALIGTGYTAAPSATSTSRIMDLPLLPGNSLSTSPGHGRWMQPMLNLVDQRVGVALYDTSLADVLSIRYLQVLGSGSCDLKMWVEFIRV
jgi:hypothetical protein